MAGRSTDRRSKGRDKTPTTETFENLTSFVLPDSISCSEIEFPILIKKPGEVSWEQILEESEKEHWELEQYVKEKQPPELKLPFQKTEAYYIQNEVFPQLLPALEDTLNKAEIWDVLKIEKSFFNGIDYIAQELWNNNPRFPERKMDNLHLFNMPWVREILKKTPRPYYPKSWLWTEEYAATLIQKSVRQYFVQCEGEVQEMRSFWKKLELEQEKSDIQTNPLLAKEFASSSLSHSKHK